MLVILVAIAASIAWFWYEYSTRPSISDENVTRIETALNSDGMEAQAEALVPEQRESYFIKDEPATSADVTVELHPDTFETGEGYGALIDATASDGAELVLALARVEDEWLILHTVWK